MQNNPQDVTETAHVVALDEKHTPLPLWGWGFRWYLELYFRGQVEVMMTIRMPLMPHLASALSLKWADQTTGSCSLTCNTKLGFAASALSENLPLFCREQLNCCFLCCCPVSLVSLPGLLLCASLMQETHMELSQFLSPEEHLYYTAGRAWKPPAPLRKLTPWLCSGQAKWLPDLGNSGYELGAVAFSSPWVICSKTLTVPTINVTRWHRVAPNCRILPSTSVRDSRSVTYVHTDLSVMVFIVSADI